MPWKEVRNVAQFKGADWSNFIRKEPRCTPERAKRIALRNPDITFFFFCREAMILEGPVHAKYGPFNPGDAVFFKGKPWYGSAPQCDAYEKHNLVVAYGGLKDFLADSIPVDIAIIFTAGLRFMPAEGDLQNAWNAQREQPPRDLYPYVLATGDRFERRGAFPVVYSGGGVYEDLKSDAVKQLQAGGTAVLMCVTNHWDEAGWSNFTDEASMNNFVQQLQQCVNRFGIDGIDIDDEYSTGTPNGESLVKITTKMREKMGNDIIISKALFSDVGYFAPQYKGKHLGDNLTYGWEMTYGGNPQSRLTPYLDHMNKGRLLLGATPKPGAGREAVDKDVDKDADWVIKNGYGGMMSFGADKNMRLRVMNKMLG